MANLNLFQALTPTEQGKIKLKDLDSAITYLWQYTLDEEHPYPTWFLRFGMPYKFPNGKYGFIVAGNSGLHTRPDPNPHDHRLSYRYGEIPMHTVEFGELNRIVVPMTIYRDKNYVELQYPEYYWSLMLKALSKTLPMYIKYLSYSIFKGKSQKMPKLDDYIGKYIKETSGNTNGYKFYLSEGYGEINLQNVITKKKVTVHKLDSALAKINAELTKEGKKIEADEATEVFLKDKKWVKENLSEGSRKFLAVLLQCQRAIDKVLFDGFEDKYRVKKETFEGVNRPVKPADLILMLPRASWQQLQTDMIFLTPGTKGFGLDSFRGVAVELVDCMDENTAYIIERDMIQFWVIPELAKNRVEPYGEGTVDYITEYAHSMEMIDIYHNIYVKHK